MLQGRLTTALVAGTVLVALAGCSGEGATGDTIPEIELTRVTAAPGSDPSGQVACMLDASHLRGALEAYRLDHDGPAPDEAALVDERYIVVASSLWDVVDGELVAEDPACEGVPSDLPATDIVTDQTDDDEVLDDVGEQLAALTPDDVLAGLSDAEIAEVGGPECAREVAEVSLAYQRWWYDHGADPDTLTTLVDEGYLDDLELWELGDTDLTATDGSGCAGPIPVLGD